MSGGEPPDRPREATLAGHTHPPFMRLVGWLPRKDAAAELLTLTLKQAWQPDRGGWVKIDDYQCRQAFRHFMNLLNRAVYGSAFRRHGKRLRVSDRTRMAKSQKSISCRMTVSETAKRSFA